MPDALLVGELGQVARAQDVGQGRDAGLLLLGGDVDGGAVGDGEVGGHDASSFRSSRRLTPAAMAARWAALR
jgi:hypothetical protein